MRRLLVTMISAAAFACAGSAEARLPDLPDTVELGRDSHQQPCVATRYWADPKLKDPFAQSYAITCRGVTGNRYLGVIRVTRKASDLADADASLRCGGPLDVVVEKVGNGRSRRCVDAGLGFETVQTTIATNGHIVSASVVPTAEGPAEEAMRLIVGSASLADERRSREIKPSVAADKLPAAPELAAASALVADTQAALEEGLRLIRSGLHLEASRVLNDALGRLPPDAPAGPRIELLLMSGLADSNLGFFAEAERDFGEADTLLRNNSNLPDAAVLVRKRQSYLALDLLNRRNFVNAAGLLDTLGSTKADPGAPLLDLATVLALNHAPHTANASEMVAAADQTGLAQVVIDTQANWARSVALLGQNKPAEAAAALRDADRSFAVLSAEPIDQQQLRWLAARIERQRARILVRNNDWSGANAALDKAIANLEAAGAGGTSFGPTLAETRMQRAAIAASQGNKSAALKGFEEGVENLISSDSRGAILPPSVEQYLDLLVADNVANPTGNAADKFFRAIQAVGDPDIARQTAELQSVVTSGGSLTAKIQDRNELETELTSIRFQIAGSPNNQPDAVAKLDARRIELEGQLQKINDALSADPSYSAVSDAPVTVEEVRAVLRPGEAYLKLVSLRSYTFGILIDANGARIYRVGVPLVELNPVIAAVRSSIDGGNDNKLPVFNVAAANALFKLLLGDPGDQARSNQRYGDVARRVLAATSVVVDPSGPLQTLPIGVLVSDQASVDSFRLSRSKAQYDYTGVNFVARQLSLSSALSPRSLLISRTKAVSDAPLPFIGFGEHMPVELTARSGNQLVSIGGNCQVELATIAMYLRELTPIKKSELVRSGEALGLPETPMVTDAAFTDTAIKQRTDLDQFQVLHFATHGLTEGQWGCAKSPPALVTSLGGPGSDAILSFDEIAKLHLNANLVVLSACDTAAGIKNEEVARAAGRESVGGSIEGLVRSFLAANARAVMTTYWSISNEGESEEFIADFYRAARSETIGDALKTAQNALMHDPATSHPVYWGAFFVIGDAAKPLLTGRALAKLAPAPVLAQQ